MFGFKKDPPKNQARTSGNRQNQRPRAQLPLFDVPDMNNFDNDFGDVDDDDDDDLEAELQALQAGLDIRKVVSRRRLEESVNPQNSKPQQEFGSDDDDDVDENDPSLLAELSNIDKDDEVEPVPNLRQPAVRVAPVPLIPTRAAPPVPRKLPQPELFPQPPPVAPPRQPAMMIPTFEPAAPVIAAPTSLSDVLIERLQMYKCAQGNAKIVGESAKVRRLDRGIKTLESMLKTVKAGKPINEAEIPPPVALGGKPKAAESTPREDGFNNDVPHMVPPQQFSNQEEPEEKAEVQPYLPPRVHRVAVPPTPPPSDDKRKPEVQLNSTMQNTLDMLTMRRNQYRQAALAAKRENDVEKLKEYITIAKKFDLVITALEEGQEVDLKNMPPPPPEFSTTSGQVPKPRMALGPKVLPPIPPMNPPTAPSASEIEEQPTGEEPEVTNAFNAPPPPTSTLEALQQRMEKYSVAMAEAKSSENSSKARRMGRIVKQYEDAIKMYKAGKSVNFDELPTPPGFAPIPKDSDPSSTSVKPPPIAAPRGAPSAIAAPTPSVTLPAPLVPSKPSPAAPSAPGNSEPPPQPPPRPNKPVQKSPQALHEKQLAAILERQKLFKLAALEAKKRGDLQAAKEYLRLSKGFEPMIQASKCGLPVNMDSLPRPPQFNPEDSFEMVTQEDCEPTGDRTEMFEKLEKDLVSQIEMSARNRVHFSKLGDVKSAQKFEAMILDTKKDLDFVKFVKKRGEPVPRFHYETRTFSIVRCFTDLGDDDLELTVIKGINYSCPNPNEIDTYVKFEFPFPVETGQRDKTATVKNTNNPEYNALFKLSINRKSRNCLSTFKRKTMKLEVWAKGGFLRSDTILGTVSFRLTPLETRCDLHDSFDLMDGRKPIGGKLEVKLRLREPIITKQVETHCEKWLIVSGAHVTRI